MTAEMAYNNWTIDKDEHDFIWLTFSRHDSSTNSLNKESVFEFETIIQQCRQSLRPKGLVIRSGKDNGFIAGADVQQFGQIKDAEEATQLILRGQQILNELENLNCPTIALISGFCLGGGLELALACQYRIVEENDKTRLGLPEVMLGIHPGWGGTVRLPRMIGSLKAMDLILTGRTVNPKQAKKMGFVDAVVPKRYLQAACCHYLKTQPPMRRASWLEKMSNQAWVRPWLGKLFRSKVAKKAKENHYPAPFAVINNWVDTDCESEAAYGVEAKSIGHLLVSPTSKNLVRVFFLQEQMKALAKVTDYKAKHLHVIGAGVMGGDIAAWGALRGLKVTLQDQNIDAIAQALGRARKLFKKKLKLPHKINQAMDALVPDREGHGIKQADVIIEAIVENINAKQGLFKKLEEQAKKEAILATNTSTIPLAEIAQALKDKTRLLGIHFFNPVPRMPLVEVVVDQKTEKSLEERAIAFVRQIDKLPLPVKSAPGFLVNRLLMPYLMESIILLEEGIPATAIDKVALDFGMPMGPIELADTVGLDVCVHAAESLSNYFGGELPKRVQQMVADGKLGKKSGEGFYKYKKGKPVKPKLDVNYRVPDDVSDRLILRMLNEAVACWREKIVSEKDLLDAGMIFGTGFSPFRGGPIHYLVESGVQNLRNRLDGLAERYGKRFSADEGWGQLESVKG